MPLQVRSGMAALEFFLQSKGEICLFFVRDQLA